MSIFTRRTAHFLYLHKLFLDRFVCLRLTKTLFKISTMLVRRSSSVQRIEFLRQRLSSWQFADKTVEYLLVIGPFWLNLVCVLLKCASRVCFLRVPVINCEACLIEFSLNIPITVIITIKIFEYFLLLNLLTHSFFLIFYLFIYLFLPVSTVAVGVEISGG